ncbi:MAG: hypothetical protein K6D91_06140 [Prevotella sp.]|nr:hypothetical protein [Prevotella sp.]
MIDMGQVPSAFDKEASRQQRMIVNNDSQVIAIEREIRALRNAENVDTAAIRLAKCKLIKKYHEYGL